MEKIYPSTLAVRITVTFQTSINCNYINLDHPVINFTNVTVCKTQISVCVDAIGTPQPSTTIEMMISNNEVVTLDKPCASFNTSDSATNVTFLITISNCFKNSTASIHLITNASTAVSSCTNKICSPTDFEDSEMKCILYLTSTTQSVNSTSASVYSSDLVTRDLSATTSSTDAADYIQTTDPRITDRLKATLTTTNLQATTRIMKDYQTKRITIQDNQLTTLATTDQPITSATTTDQQTESPPAAGRRATRSTTTIQQTLSISTSDQKTASPTVDETQTSLTKIDQQTVSPNATPQQKTISATTYQQPTSTIATTTNQQTSRSTTDKKQTGWTKINQQTVNLTATTATTTTTDQQGTILTTTYQQPTSPITADQQTKILSTANQQITSRIVANLHITISTTTSHHTTIASTGSTQMAILNTANQHISTTDQQISIEGRQTTNPTTTKHPTPKQEDSTSQGFPAFVVAIVVIIVLLVVATIFIGIIFYKRRKAKKARALLQELYLRSTNAMELTYEPPHDKDDISIGSLETLPSKADPTDNNSLWNSSLDIPAKQLKTFPVIYSIPNKRAKSKMNSLDSDSPNITIPLAYLDNNSALKVTHLDEVLQLDAEMSRNATNHNPGPNYANTSDLVNAAKRLSQSSLSQSSLSQSSLSQSDATPWKKTEVSDINSTTFIE
ncbi:mucin-22-like [Corticium candelabrum]|uniref:mucin-22-like n=1 Tax=Corticium candelabrum TaxID=121492 RepID=UPI002E2615BD|nr:mucin-22-like [Corticium candelabrum]